jgi:hypothetical protein
MSPDMKCKTRKIQLYFKQYFAIRKGKLYITDGFILFLTSETQQHLCYFCSIAQEVLKGGPGDLEEATGFCVSPS